MRVAIDARIVSGQPGGLEQFLVGLAHGFSRLGSAGSFDFIVLPGHRGWIEPYLAGPCCAVELARTSGALASLQRAALLNPSLGPVGARLSTLVPPEAIVPRSDRALAALGHDVVHFALQWATVSSTPSVYNPHDLQHRHLPQYFSRRTRHMRDSVYQGMCAQADTIAVSSQWTRRDLMRQYGIPHDKISVVELASPLSTCGPSSPVPVLADLVGDSIAREGFALYPAQTWPHKNHIRLLEAVAWLRDREHLRVPLVCVGRKTKYFPRIQARLEALGLEPQVRFLGFVSPETLCSLYRAARFVVVPTEFESGSFPLYEAFAMGVPAAVSAVTSLPEQAGDAALLFSPTDVLQIVGAMRRLWLDGSLRSDLSGRSLARAKGYSWTAVAEQYATLYEGALRRRSAPSGQ